MSEPLRVLFVCTANICRSPAMELIARQMAGPGADVVFSSSGTHARNRHRMSSDMAATLPAGAADEFRSRHLTAEMLAGSDLVLTAEQVHRQHILDDFPQLHPQVFTLGQFAAAVVDLPDQTAPHLQGQSLVAAAFQRRTPTVPEHDVADPYRRGRAAAETATGTITAMLSVIVPRLTGSPAVAGDD